MAIKFASRDQDLPLSSLIRHDVYGSIYPDISERRDDFVSSLKHHGQQINIVVVKSKNGYAVIDGYQRWQVAAQLEWPTIKADIISTGYWFQLSEEQRKQVCKDLNEERRHLQFSEKVKKYKEAKKGKPGPKPELNEIISFNYLGHNPAENQQSADSAAENAGYCTSRAAQLDVNLFDATIPSVHDAIDTKTINKKQAKEIAAFPKTEQPTALERAIAGEPIKPAPEKEPAILDCLDKPVPESLNDIFVQVPEWNRAMRLVSDLKSEIKKLSQHAAAGWLDLDDTERLLKQVRANLRFAMPHTECPKCKRKLQKDCKACKGTGWIHESMYRSCASDADKKWLEARK